MKNSNTSLQHNAIPAGEILHDYFAIRGGGEKLILTLADHLDFPVSTGFIKSRSELKSDWPQVKMHSIHAFHGFAALQMLSLIKRWSQYSLVHKGAVCIYSGVYAPLAINKNLHKNNILYCHTPPRFIYDKYDYYMKQLPFWQRPVLKWLIHYFKPKYEASVEQMDIIIANSCHIQRRIKYFLNKESIVIYPPCDTTGFQWQSQGDYYLSTARLDGLKRVELLIRAFMQMPEKKLIITSGGKEYKKLKKLASHSPNIQFTHWVSDKTLQQLVGNCIATLYIPQDEDFGISPVESMAAGKPVLGVAEGGLKETILHQQSGFLLDSSKKLEVKEIIKALQWLTPQQALSMKISCQQQAEKFSEQRFLQKMKQVIIDSNYTSTYASSNASTYTSSDANNHANNHASNDASTK